VDKLDMRKRSGNGRFGQIATKQASQ